MKKCTKAELAILLANNPNKSYRAKGMKDSEYCYYDESFTNPFRFIAHGEFNDLMDDEWRYEYWEEYKPDIPDKSLIECWDNDAVFARDIRFYDAKNNSTFYAGSGCRNAQTYDNYRVIPDTNWAVEARKHLKD